MITDEEKKIQKVERPQCDTCGTANETVMLRVDNGLAAGTHCSKCWYKMVAECRSRSW